MCDKCEKLVKCDPDHKATTVLVKHDAFDTTKNQMIMQLNHDEVTKEPFAFISDQITIGSTNRCYGNIIDIQYCPFCGEKLY